MPVSATSWASRSLLATVIASCLVGGATACTPSHGGKFRIVDDGTGDAVRPGDGFGCDPDKVNDVPAGCGSLCVDGTWTPVLCRDAGANSGPQFIFDDAGNPVTPAGCQKHEYLDDPCAICVGERGERRPTTSATGLIRTCTIPTPHRAATLGTTPESRYLNPPLKTANSASTISVANWWRRARTRGGAARTS